MSLSPKYFSNLTISLCSHRPKAVCYAVSQELSSPTWETNTASHPRSHPSINSPHSSLSDVFKTQILPVSRTRWGIENKLYDTAKKQPAKCRMWDTEQDEWPGVSHQPMASEREEDRRRPVMEQKSVRTINWRPSMIGGLCVAPDSNKQLYADISEKIRGNLTVAWLLDDTTCW